MFRKFLCFQCFLCCCCRCWSLGSFSGNGGGLTVPLGKTKSIPRFSLSIRAVAYGPLENSPFPSREGTNAGELSHFSLLVRRRLVLCNKMRTNVRTLPVSGL